MENEASGINFTWLSKQPSRWLSSKDLLTNH